MAISTYAELQGAIADWMARSDISAARVIDFITMFEAAANRRLRVRQMVTTDDITPSSGVGTLPTDYLSTVRLTWLGSATRELEYVHPDYLYAVYTTTPSGPPQHYTIQGSSLIVRPIDDTADLRLEYHQKVPALSDSNTTNWLLTAHPDVYLFGSLLESCSYTQDEKGLIWKARRDELFTEIERLSEKSKAPAIMRLWGSAP
jgi:hypothetical protein